MGPRQPGGPYRGIMAEIRRVFFQPGRQFGVQEVYEHLVSAGFYREGKRAKACTRRLLRDLVRQREVGRLDAPPVRKGGRPMAVYWRVA